MFEPEYFEPVLDKAIPVRLAARSFIIPVPMGIGQPMVYPFDVEECPEMKKGSPILGKDGVQKTGIAFINYTDGTIVQDARDDGKDVIIINGISSEQGEKLLAHYKQIIPDTNKITENGIREMLRYAHEELGINDFFDGNLADVPNFEPEMRHPDNNDCGVFIRRNSQERFALVGIGSGSYTGPASSPQRFLNNVVVLTNKKRTWMVQTEAFLLTYRHPDNRNIEIGDLPAFVMREGTSPIQTQSLKLT